MAKYFRILNVVFSVQGLKSIGYVQLILSHPTTSSSGKTLRAAEAAPAPTLRPYVALGFAALALVAAFSIPLLHK